MYWLRVIVLFIAAVFASVQFWIALRKKYRYLMSGAQEDRSDNGTTRFYSFLQYVLAQRKVLAEPAGIGHFFIFWGFIVLCFGTLDFVGIHILGHHLWLVGETKWFRYSHEFFSLLVFIAIGIAAARRYLIRPMRLDQSRDAYLILGFIAALIVTDLVTAGLDVALGDEHPGWSAPIASGLGLLFSSGSEIALNGLKELFVWLHIAVLLSFMVYIPHSKHLHMIAAPFNTYYRSLRPKGQLKKLDLEDETIEEFGVGKINQFTWKQLLDGYACTECGRCHVNCPATLTDKPLSPKHLILKMRDHLTDVGESVLAKQLTALSSGANALDVNRFSDLEELPLLVGNVYSEEEIWACTTCRACEEACPVFNEHVDKIIDLRRYLVMTEGSSTPEIKRAFTNLERHSNEWGQNRNKRADWAKDLQVRTMAEVDEPVEYLYYVGSAASFDQRNQKIARAFVQLLNHAGVDYAILGTEEESDGDAARRLGNEMLFQTLVETNIELFRTYNVKKIITTDPHAFNTFKNEYVQFGFEAEVIHATEFLARLVEEGRITPTEQIDLTLTYHDSCYLGRYNGVYSAPRFLLSKIPGIEVVEMERNRERGMCCGAGGGSMWKEETGTRINVFRVEQAMETGAQAIGTACPFCMTMMVDGTKQKGVEEQMPTYDVVELLAMSITPSADAVASG